MLHQANSLGASTRIFFSQLYQTVKPYLNLFVPRLIVLSDWLPVRIFSAPDSCHLAGCFSCYFQKLSDRQRTNLDIRTGRFGVLDEIGRLIAKGHALDESLKV